MSVLITGCSSGIGKALARQFAKKNHRVFATARKIDSLKDLGCDESNFICLDVADEDSIKGAVQKVIDQAGRIDMVINNAGFGLMGPIAELPIEYIRKQFETNVVGPLALIQAAVPHMVKQKSGRIVNVGSVSGVLTSPFSGAYCASKAALHSVSDALRMELGPFGIEVITIQPGGIVSKFGDNAMAMLSKVIKPDSIYAPILPFIKERAMAGQKDAMGVDEFAEKIVLALTRKNPPELIRLGANSFSLPAYRWGLPYKVVDSIMARKFGLNELKKRLDNL